MWMTVAGHHYAIKLDDTEAARGFVAMLPLTLRMAELNGNEKHGDLPGELLTDEHRPGSIHNGDLLLWGSRTIVVFYKTFRSPYAYTRMGRIEHPESLPQTLGSGNVQIEFSSR